MVVLSVLWMMSIAHAEDQGAPLIAPLAQESKLMGKPLKIEETAYAVPSGLGVSNQTTTQFLGHTSSLVTASVEAIPSTADAALTAASASSTPAPSTIQLAKTDLYIGGTRIWAGTLRYEKGGLVYSGGVAPTQIPFPLFTYPLGPLLLEVDAGVEFEGDLEASLLPGLSYPLPDSTLDASLQAKLSVAGYIEGYASLWIVRGGVGGRVDFIEGTTGISAHLYMNGQRPAGSYLGKVVLLQGDVYGFVDTNLLFGKWTRILKKDFYKWNGFCYSFGADSCALN